MKKLRLVSLLILTVLTLSSCNKTDQTPPNIIWIFSDDHSYQTIGAYGGHLQGLDPTPNIDRLAAEGMRFNRCYVENSICAPSRATLLTGKMSHLHGKYNNWKQVEFDHDQQQFQKILQVNGYQTAMIGKIHLFGQMQGFDYWEVLIGQGSYVNPVLLSVEGEKSYEGYTTDIITDKALDWLQRKRNADKPFMLMVHNKAPHRAWIPARKHMQKYEDMHIPEPANLHDDYSTRTTAALKQKMSILFDMNYTRDLKMIPAESEWELKNGFDDRFKDRYEKYKNTDLETKNEALTSLKYQEYLKDYLRCIWSVDENVGRIMDYLEETGLDKNTVVMYSSDQGFYMGEHGWFDKRFMYEESYRTPLIVRWPGVVKPGSVNSDLVQNIDFAETFLDLCGAPIPVEMQGKSLVPLLQGKTPSDWRKSLYYHYYEYPGAHSVRRHEGISGLRYKLIRYYGLDVPGNEEWEFFDLQEDPSEMNNEYGNERYSTEIEEMKTELKRLREFYQVNDHIIPQTENN